MVDYWVVTWICGLQRHGAPALLVEEQIAHGERVLAVDGEVVILLRAAVQLCVPELHVGLVGQEAHWVTAVLPFGVAP